MILMLTSLLYYYPSKARRYRYLCTLPTRHVTHVLKPFCLTDLWVYNGYLKIHLVCVQNKLTSLWMAIELCILGTSWYGDTLVMPFHRDCKSRFWEKCRASDVTAQLISIYWYATRLIMFYDETCTIDRSCSLLVAKNAKKGQYVRVSTSISSLIVQRRHGVVNIVHWKCLLWVLFYLHGLFQSYSRLLCSGI